MEKLPRKTLSAGRVIDDKSVEDILVNLPVKSLMRFKCVSKIWKSFIEEDSSFIQSHLSRSKARPPLLIKICNSICVFSPKDHHHHGSCFKGGVDFLNKVTVPWSHGSALKPIHGLFCIVDALDAATCVYNLNTRQTTPWAHSSISPRGDSDEISQVYGLDFDPLTNKYKILCVWETPARSFEYGGRSEFDYICEVFTVGGGGNQWRQIDEVPPVRLAGPAVYASGSIYMRNDAFCNFFSFTPENKVIVAFDVGTEKFRIIRIPNFIVRNLEGRGGRCKRAKDLLQIDGHIAVVDRVDVHIVKLWISDDDTSSKKKKMATTNWTGKPYLVPCS